MKTAEEFARTITAWSPDHVKLLAEHIEADRREQAIHWLEKAADAVIRVDRMDENSLPLPSDSVHYDCAKAVTDMIATLKAEQGDG